MSSKSAEKILFARRLLTHQALAFPDLQSLKSIWARTLQFLFMVSDREVVPLTSRGSKLVALALIAVVLAAGAGYWFLTPKMPNELVSTVQQTSLLTPSKRTQISTTSTTPTSGTTTWINVGASQPASYYLSVLESNGTKPYVELAKELRKLPDLKNATAMAKITYLALNATNPEVKEAFELMMKGGTPSPSDFTYSIVLASGKRVTTYSGMDSMTLRIRIIELAEASSHCISLTAESADF